MRKRSDILPAIFGGTLGIALVGYAVVYLPMKRNHDECGRVTLCDSDASLAEDPSGAEPRSGGSAGLKGIAQTPGETP